MEINGVMMRSKTTKLEEEVTRLKNSYLRLSPFWKYFYPSRLKQAIETSRPSLDISNIALNQTWFFQRWLFSGLSNFINSPVVKKARWVIEEGFYFGTPANPVAVAVAEAIANFIPTPTRSRWHTTNIIFKPLLSDLAHKSEIEEIILLLNEVQLLNEKNLNTLTTRRTNEIFLKKPYGEISISILQRLKQQLSSFYAAPSTGYMQDTLDALVQQEDIKLATERGQLENQQRQRRALEQQREQERQRAALSYRYPMARAAPIVPPQVTNADKLTKIHFEESDLSKEQQKTYNDKYLCSISFQIMTVPVYDPAWPKSVFDRASILEWLKNNNSHPITRKRLYTDMLIENSSLKQEIDAFVHDQEVLHQTKALQPHL